MPVPVVAQNYGLWLEIVAFFVPTESIIAFLNSVKLLLRELSEMKTDYDLAVIGAGQGGLPAAALAAHLGAQVALIEMREVGGT